MERRLAADVVGYSRLMGSDEAGTLTQLKHLRAKIIERKVAEHRSMPLNTADSALDLLERCLPNLGTGGRNWESTIPTFNRCETIPAFSNYSSASVKVRNQLPSDVLRALVRFDSPARA